MTDRFFDVLVIGGGPGGYVAAIRAAQLGLRTALVEQKHLGGICLNWGCIPTKTMLQGAELAHSLSQSADLGFSLGDIRFDFSALVDRSRAVSGKLTAGVEGLLKKHRVAVFEGKGKLVAKGVVEVKSQTDSLSLKATHIILATGAKPRMIPGLEAVSGDVWTYFQALSADNLPDSLLVIGSGAIGVEFASMYSDLGVPVTMLEQAGQILPQEDRDVSAAVAAHFKARSITVHTGSALQSVENVEGGVKCVLCQPDGTLHQVVVDKILVAAGVQANSEGIGLETLGVRCQNGFVQVDEWGRTNVAGVYAIGDLTGAPCLAHKASHEGVICVERLAGVASAHPLDRRLIPACTYGRPQVASFGLTEDAARKSMEDVRVGMFPLHANGKSLAMGNQEGFVKSVFDGVTGQLVGAHMVGPEVTEQIQGFLVAANLEGTEDELMSTVFPHPSLSEAMHESVLAAFGRALHI